MSRTWWGERFLEALEGFTDPGRLSRGRSYLRNQRITSFKLEDGKLTARVRGSINPYYGVYEEPLYAISVQLNAIPPKKWDELIKTLGSRAGMITRLLLNEMPESINTMFGKARMTLLPASSTDFTTDCSCPDYDNPCKHIAGVCYLLASKLDQDPLLLFELRGLSRDRLRTALIKTPLGKVLAKSLADEEDTTPTPSTSFHTRPQRQKAAKIRYGDFWGSYGTLPPEPPPPAPVLPAILVRKGGDFPPFWDLERSFVETMMELYERVRRASKVGSY
jgi:uncharacterized Zn finger protein